MILVTDKYKSAVALGFLNTGQYGKTIVECDYFSYFPINQSITNDYNI